MRQLFEENEQIMAALPLVWLRKNAAPAKKKKTMIVKEKPPRQRRYIQRHKPGTAPRAVVLFGGGYSMYLTQNGSGGAYHDGLCVYRASKDANLESRGVYIYVKTDDQLITPCFLPSRPKGVLTSIFEPHKAEHILRAGRLETKMESTVDPSTGAEIRIITVENKSQTDKTV